MINSSLNRNISINNLLKTRLISISRERTQEFELRNPHIKIDNFSFGIKEEELKEEEIDLIATKAITKLAKKVPGSIGNAHSIFCILKECISEDIHYLILEDDTQIHPNINEFIINDWEMIKKLDVLLLGGNTNSPITFEILNGMPLSGVFSGKKDKHPSYERINKIFSKTLIQDIKTYKLNNIFGSHAWIVSPRGAKKLIKNCFPLDIQPINIPLFLKSLSGISFDRRWNSTLGIIDARICIPFLALTPNLNKTSR